MNVSAISLLLSTVGLLTVCRRSLPDRCVFAVACEAWEKVRKWFGNRRK